MKSIRGLRFFRPGMLWTMLLGMMLLTGCASGPRLLDEGKIGKIKVRQSSSFLMVSGRCEEPGMGIARVTAQADGDKLRLTVSASSRYAGKPTFTSKIKLAPEIREVWLGNTLLWRDGKAMR